MRPPATLRSLAVALALGLGAIHLAQADDPPKFSAPEVNAYVQKFVELTDEYIVAIKHNDGHRMRELDKQAKDLEGDGLLQSKIKPEEIGPFDRFLAAQATKIRDAGVTAGSAK